MKKIMACLHPLKCQFYNLDILFCDFHSSLSSEMPVILFFVYAPYSLLKYKNTREEKMGRARDTSVALKCLRITKKHLFLEIEEHQPI